jgi:hypothetical protein
MKPAGVASTRNICESTPSSSYQIPNMSSPKSFIRSNPQAGVLRRVFNRRLSEKGIGRLNPMYQLANI